MKATKRLLLLLLGVMFAFALAACDDGEEKPAPAETETPAGYTVMRRRGMLPSRRLQAAKNMPRERA